MYHTTNNIRTQYIIQFIHGHYLLTMSEHHRQPNSILTPLMPILILKNGKNLEGNNHGLTRKLSGEVRNARKNLFQKGM
jgi:hypothetical protein